MCYWVIVQCQVLAVDVDLPSLIRCVQDNPRKRSAVARLEKHQPLIPVHLLVWLQRSTVCKYEYTYDIPVVSNICRRYRCLPTHAHGHYFVSLFSTWTCSIWLYSSILCGPDQCILSGQATAFHIIPGGFYHILLGCCLSSYVGDCTWLIYSHLHIL